MVSAVFGDAGRRQLDAAHTRRGGKRFNETPDIVRIEPDHGFGIMDQLVTTPPPPSTTSTAKEAGVGPWLPEEDSSGHHRAGAVGTCPVTLDHGLQSAISRRPARRQHHTD